jgi:hypothetical protein
MFNILTVYHVAPCFCLLSNLVWSLSRYWLLIRRPPFSSLQKHSEAFTSSIRSESQLWSTLRAWSELLFLPFPPVKSNVTLEGLAVPVEVITFWEWIFLKYTKCTNNPPANNYINSLFYVHGESLKNGRKSKRHKSKMIIPPEISD